MSLLSHDLGGFGLLSKSMPRRKILVLENYRQTLPVMRSLADKGWDVVLGVPAAAREDERFAQASRCVHETWAHPPLTQGEFQAEFQREFIDALTARLRADSEIEAIFPVGEVSLAVLTRHRDRIASSERAVRVISPDPEIVWAALNKHQMAETARGLGLPVPEWRVARSTAELQAAIDEIGFPCVIKAIDSFHRVDGRKAVILSSVDALSGPMAYGRIFAESAAGLIVQRQAFGARHNCQFMADQGTLIAYFESRVLRTDAWDGTGYGVDTVSVQPSSERRSWVSKIVENLNYSGAGCVQFLVDAEDRSQFLELNPRLDATVALAVACGVDFPKLAVDVAFDVRTPPRVLPYAVSRRMVWIYGDWMGLLQSARAREISLAQALAWFARSLLALTRFPRHMTWSWRDPAPTLRAYLLFARGVLRKIFRRGA